MSETERDNAGVVAPPPLIYFGPLLAGVLLHRVRPASALPRGLARALGWPLLLGGVALGTWFAVTMRRAGTSADPREPVARLVTWGPFRYSRNPGYAAFTLVYAGLALLVDTTWPLVWLPAILAVMRRGVIEREERYLERAFGEEYARYKGRVRRWL